jgi:foldase protein PrsA
VLELVAATLAVALAGGPGDAVATVDGDPIEKRTYRHWMRVAAKADENASQAQRRRQTLHLLISAKWIEHEAAERGIVVSDEEVRRSLESQKAQSFPKERDYRKFLRESGRTEADILLERRDVRIVKTWSRRRALQARRALRSGRPWRDVAKR